MSDLPVVKLTMDSLPFPAPEDLWGDYSVDGWSMVDLGRFSISLMGISSHIIYANQKTIDRVNDTIRNIIARAKNGELSPDEACKEVHAYAIFSTEEREEIHKNAAAQGETMANFYKSRNANKQ